LIFATKAHATRLKAQVFVLPEPGDFESPPIQATFAKKLSKKPRVAREATISLCHFRGSDWQVITLARLPGGPVHKYSSDAAIPISGMIMDSVSRPRRLDPTGL
jgi:hypothetical protein